MVPSVVRSSVAVTVAVGILAVAAAAVVAKQQLQQAVSRSTSISNSYVAVWPLQQLIASSTVVVVVVVLQCPAAVARQCQKQQKVSSSVNK